ncbi:MAG: phosphatase PAP2 family protein [Chloroflexia bacterium]|nr:phosphatase PAP2 family protein [Chloroflexia bacterium]
MSLVSTPSARVSRRALMGAGLTGAAVASLPRTASRTAASHVPESRVASRSWQEGRGDPANWRTWLLDSADELRPPAPDAPSQTEIDEVVEAQADPSDETAAAIKRWGSGPAVIPWSVLARELSAEFSISGMPQNRFMAIYHTALHDAVIAAWDAQVAHDRPSPGATSDEITPSDGVNPERSSFPSEHAAVAGAAATVLAYLIPDATSGRFDALATEAAESRIAAGAAFRGDVEVGLALGQAIGEKAVARAKDDGAGAEWDPSTMPTGPGFWQPTPPGFVETPFAPLAGAQQTWVMTSGDQFRPAPPPDYGSEAWKSELETVQEIAANRSFEQERAAVWWGTNSPAGLSNGWTHELILRDGLDSPHAARILADVHVAIADSSIAVWDAKYTWWTARPITEDPNLKTVLTNPPYPSYPSGYSGVMGAATTVIGYYFPETVDDMAARAWEAAASRGWAGIHYVIDDDIGLLMGRQVGRLVCSLARTDPVDGAA